jgi:mono/diheme cytochrome c family protein
MKKVLNNTSLYDMHLMKRFVLGAGTALILAACGASGDNPGTEYAPNMYHSVAYEPLTQITDEDAGRWVTSIEYPDNHAEYFNSNKLNLHDMNMREPAKNTVRRNPQGWLPYRIHKDSLAYAARTLKNPLDSTEAIVAAGKVLYNTYCDHCHGASGKGDGKVAEFEGQVKYAGIANLTSDALKPISEGHIFHVITQGKGLMWPHGSQISPEDRWKIAKYVKTLQK